MRNLCCIQEPEWQTVLQPQLAQPTPEEEAHPVVLRLEALEERVAPGIVWGD